MDDMIHYDFKEKDHISVNIYKSIITVNYKGHTLITKSLTY